MISVRGSRRVPYSEFHTGYKRNVLAADELLYAIHLKRRFARHVQYLRKVGTRRAMAVAKVALGATAIIEESVIREVRLGAASLAPYPTRLIATEASCWGKASHAKPCWRRGAHCSQRCSPSMTFVRRPSTGAVWQRICWMSFCSNCDARRKTMNETLAAWNVAEEAAALEAMLACCGSKRWATGMLALRPIGSLQELSIVADHMWNTMREPDWLEAFACHPRIGERKTAAHAGAQSAAWSQQEQSRTSAASESAAGRACEGESSFTRSGSDSPTSFAQRAKLPTKCLQFSSGGCRAIARLNFARLPSSNGRLCRFVWESG